MQPLPGQLSLLADTNDLDDVQNAPEARYDGLGGLVGPGGSTWRGYSPDTSEDAARRLFRVRFGHDPLEVRRGLGGVVLAGPICAGGAM